MEAVAVGATIREATTAAVAEDAAAKCSSRRGSLGQASYATSTDWLGVPYAIEGVFVRAGSQVLQLEVLVPEQRAAAARELLAAWARRLE